jgi:hypothetical protein
MRKKNKSKCGKSHHLFTNKVLNNLFCSTKEDMREFCREAVETYDEWFGEPITLMGQRENRIISYHAAMVETAFELGWNEAMKRASKVMLEDLL